MHYKNCKCRKKLVDKLVEECTENVKEVILAKLTSAEDENKRKNKCSSRILYIALFTINFGIGSYFVYYKYINRDKKNDVEKEFIFQITITKRNSNKLINGANQKN